MDTVRTLPRGRSLTRDDLDAMPDDGHRYELIDGSLVVTPAPLLDHQRVVGALYYLMRGGCPADLEVLLAPFDVALGHDTVMQPDLLVAPRADLTPRDLPAAPVLVIEVLSPSTRHIDLTLKRSRFEAAGCTSYWVTDPAIPSLTAWELHAGRYADPHEVSASDTFHPRVPFAVDITPADLLR